MSSIRLFILSSFAELGPMHGHRLRTEAERSHVHLWTDISVGAVYGAMKRLAAEGLLRETGQEREGNRPTRQLYEITDEGRAALDRLRRTGLTEIWFKYDPFDLALTRSNVEARANLPAILSQRLQKMRALLEESRQTLAGGTFGPTKRWALRHTEYRLEAEIAYLTDLLAAVSSITAADPEPPKPAAKPSRK